MISIIMPFYNDEKFIKDSVESLLNQTYKDFELLMIDDLATDNSLKVVRSFKDKRIRVYLNKKNMGIAKCRNKGIKLAKGKYIFFTDSDCIADKNWLKEGVKSFEKSECLGVEGKTYYINKNYKKSLSDKTPGDVNASGQYLGCNMAFRKDVMVKLNGYDESYKYHDDREFATRVLKIGKICKNDDMIIIHQKKLWTVESYIKSGIRAADRVKLFKYHNDKSFIHFRILFPKNLLKILIPPLILIPLFKHKNKTLLDYKLIIAAYPFYVYQRYNIWKAAIREKVFII